MLFEELSKIKRSSIMTSIILAAIGIVMILCPPQYVGSLVAVLGYVLAILSGVMILNYITNKKSLINCVKFAGALIILLLGIAILVFENIMLFIGIVFGVVLVAADAAAKILEEKYPLQYGLCGVIEGTLPIGGLSSSAAVIICFLKALCRVNGLHLDPWELIMTAKRAENEYVGVNCGKLDQSCEVLGRKDRMLYLDCKDDSYQLIPTAEDMKPYSFAIFFSGLERSLKNSAYNLRQDECKAAAYSLLARAGLEYGKFKDTRLRDVPADVYYEYRDILPAPFRKRADHYYSEFNRAENGAEAWRNGDIDTYGSLVFESGRSSIVNYECGSPELIRLYDIMTETDGIYGGRFSGAGFRGCCMALIDPEKEEEIKQAVTSAYLKSFPALEGKFSVHFCRSADGVEI